MVLSGRDDLVPVQHVSSMVLHETTARLMVSPKDKHAGFLFNLAWQWEVVAGVWDLISGCNLKKQPSEKQQPSARGSSASGDAADVRAAPRRALAPPPLALVPSPRRSSGAGAGVNGGAGSARRTPHAHSDSAFSISLGSFDAGSGGEGGSGSATVGGSSGSTSDAGDSPPASVAGGGEAAAAAAALLRRRLSSTNWMDGGVAAVGLGESSAGVEAGGARHVPAASSPSGSRGAGLGPRLGSASECLGTQGRGVSEDSNV